MRGCDRVCGCEYVSKLMCGTMNGCVRCAIVTIGWDMFGVAQGAWGHVNGHVLMPLSNETQNKTISLSTLHHRHPYACNGHTPGCWSMKQNASRSMVTLSSLRFPGYFFFSKVNSSMYGGAYFGNGIENTDLIFMI